MSFGCRTKGVTPWDYGDIQPPLKEAIEESGIDFAKSGRALVPGCGAVCPTSNALYNKSLDGGYTSYRGMIYHTYLVHSDSIPWVLTSPTQQ